jgi:hypothetical protein
MSGLPVWRVIKGYLLVVAFLFVTMGFYQEAKHKKTGLGVYIRRQLGHHDFHDFLAK